MTTTERDQRIEEEHHEMAGGRIAEAARHAGPTASEAAQPRDPVRFTVDIDVYDLGEEFQGELPRVIRESVEYALGDEAVIDVAEVGEPAITDPTPPRTPAEALRWAADRWRREAIGVNEWDTESALRRWADELDAAPAVYALPAGITLDMVRWHCSRCGTRGTWTQDPNDPLEQAVAEAWGHHANHEQWAAERAARRGPLSTTPPAGTGAQHG